MDSMKITMGLVFMTGMVSFLSPCVLPIVPAYLTLISGLTFEELQEADSVHHARWRLFGSALGFIFGFSVVLVLLFGSLATLISSFSPEWKSAFRWIGGLVVFIFALHMLGVFRIKFLFQERRFHLRGNKFGYLGAVVIGAAFAFGWSPCLGPTLGSLFSLAAGTAKTSSVWWYFVVYAAGLAVPFMLAAVFVNLFLGSLRKMTRHLRTIEIVTGVLLLLMGLLLVTNNLTFISGHGGFLATLSQRMEGYLQ